MVEILAKLTAVDSGPLFAGYGPLDLQCKWVLTVCEENFTLCDTPLLLNLVYSISRLALRQLRLLTPSLTPQWSGSGVSNISGKDNQLTKVRPRLRAVLGDFSPLHYRVLSNSVF